MIKEGLSQNDTLVAAQGHQTLTGLAGSDQFVFNGRGHPEQRSPTLIRSMMCWSWDPHNWWKAANHDAPKVEFDHGNTVIHAAGDTIVLNNVDPQELIATNFLLHT